MSKAPEANLEMVLPDDDVDYETRTIYIFGEIIDTSLRFIKILRNLDKTKGPIKVVICSPGGIDPVGIALHDAILNLKNKVTIEVVGEVSSIASVILQAGDVRLMTENSTLMIHNGSFHSHEDHIDTHKLTLLKNSMDLMNSRSNKILAKRSRNKLDKINEWCNKETVFTAREAVKARLADKVI